MNDKISKREFKGRIFLGADGRPYMAKRYHDHNVWLFSLHPDGRWVTSAKLTEQQAQFLVPDNLSDAQQAAYPSMES